MDDTELFTILLSETVLHARRMDYFTKEDLYGYEPYLMFALPRLSIVYGLLHKPDYLGLSEHHVGIRWLRDVHGEKVKLLGEVQRKLKLLPIEQVSILERMLVNNAPSVTEPAEEEEENHREHHHHQRPQQQQQEDQENEMPTDSLDLNLMVVHENQLHGASEDYAVLQGLFRSIARVADEMHTGSRAKEFVSILGRVFRMHTADDDEDDDEDANSTGRTANGSRTTNKKKPCMPKQRHTMSSTDSRREMMRSLAQTWRSRVRPSVNGGGGASAGDSEVAAAGAVGAQANVTATSSSSSPTTTSVPLAANEEPVGNFFQRTFSMTLGRRPPPAPPLPPFHPSRVATTTTTTAAAAVPGNHE